MKKIAATIGVLFVLLTPTAAEAGMSDGGLMSKTCPINTY